MMHGIRLLLAAISIILSICPCLGQAINISFSDELSNIAFHNNLIYLAEKNKLHVLTSDDLNIVTNVETCPGVCENINRVLIVDNDRLITCGTGNSQFCEQRPLSDIRTIKKNSNSLVVKISAYPNRPVIGKVLKEGYMLLVMTNNTDLPNPLPETYKYPMQTVPIGLNISYAFPPYPDSFTGNEYRFRLNIDRDIDPSPVFLIFYKAVIVSEPFTYILTNQPNFVSDTNYVSKLISICTNDLKFLSYADLMITCSKDGQDFNLLQDATILGPGLIAGLGAEERLFVGSFTSSENPELVNGDSAICIEKLSILNERILDEKKMTRTCNMTKRITEQQRYLKTDWRDKTKCFSSINDSFTDATCAGVYSILYPFVIGLTPHNLKAVFTMSGKQGYITKLTGHVVSSTNTTVIMAGTSQGHLLQMNVLKFGEDLELFGDAELDQLSPVQAIHISGDHYSDPVFVMTKKKLFKIPKANCLSATCDIVMKDRNPYCGWCVYSNRSTLLEDCPQNRTNHWLSSLSTCITMTTSPPGLQADNTEKIVTLTLNPFPEKLAGDTYKCHFLTEGNNILISKSVANFTSPGNVTCQTPKRTEHQKISLELWVTSSNQSSVRLAVTDFLFYKCDHYKRCGECVQTVETMCSWCLDLSVCNVTCPGDENSTLTNYSQCPQLLSKEPSYIHHGLLQKVQFSGMNLVPGANYTCLVEGNVSVTATHTLSTVTCILKLSIREGEKTERRHMTVLYKVSGTNITTELDDPFNTSVIIYHCGKLVDDCSHCQGLNTTRYNCDWCGKICGFNNTDCNVQSHCPAPNITSISPIDGPDMGGIAVTLMGSNLGVQISDISNITLAGVVCTNITAAKVSTGPDFIYPVPDSISCFAGKAANQEGTNTRGVVTVNGLPSNGSANFTYKTPHVTSINPSFGPKVGGTHVTFGGNNLGVGNKIVQVRYNNDTDFYNCVVVYYRLSIDINCTVPSTLKDNMTWVAVQFASPHWYYYKINFSLVNNPKIDKLSSQEFIVSGGTRIEMSGQYLNNSHSCSVFVKYKDTVTITSCDIESSTKAVLMAPAAPYKLKEDLNNTVRTRRRRELSSHSIGTEMTLKLDGVEAKFNITYFPDPQFDSLPHHPYTLPDDQQLVLTGSRLDLVARKEDYNVTIGTGICSILDLTNNSLTCIAPKDKPSPGIAGIAYPEVNVTVGRLRFVEIGFIEYKEEVKVWIIILAAIAGSVFVLVVIGVVVGCVMYKRQIQQKRLLQKKLQDTEMEIKRVAREEFLDMHTTMLSVNKSLVEQGFPFHSYQKYACNVMFAADQLLYDKLVSRLTDKTQKGMEALENLLLNKFFIVSVISTLERQKKFFFREKANFAGNLSAIFMGKMTYLQEIVQVLVENFIQEAVNKKQHKTVFRRCESITENLLSNWLALTLYPHFKTCSGSPLYLLYMAMQKTMESGPIDAITGDAKCTLSEEKLLKKWCSTDAGVTEVRFEAKPLTLKVIVDNGEQVYDCKALDCDTITQVKTKCVSQIYVNFHASQLTVDPKDLSLEWHAGHSGSLSLKDEDSTSHQEGEWLRLNTLAHYNVQDYSNMALIDPRCAQVQQQEDYVNLQQVILDVKPDKDSSILLPSVSKDDVHSVPQKRWHLVKASVENEERPERSATEDLYLNRLFTTKQSILQYMKTLFEVILDHSHCPPPIKFLFDLLDEVGEKHKVDPETIHAWKSHSYAVRVWGILIRQPDKLFDIHVPCYVEDSLNVIAQVFNESFSLTPQKFTKDSSAQKLIFHNEMNHTREKVKTFYGGVKFLDEQKASFTSYLTDLNKVQLQDPSFFNKRVFLYKLYQQLQPYLDDIIDDLSMNSDCCKLGLKNKFEEVASIMEEEAL